MNGVVLDTPALFKTHFVCWRFLGLLPPNNYIPLYWFYSFLVNVLVTIGYPLHLILGLFISTNMYEIIQSLAITLTCLVCAIKTLAIWYKFDQLSVIFDIVRRQDKRLHCGQEIKYLKTKVYPSIRRVINLFYTLCLTIGITTEAAVLFSGLYNGEWRLMYQAYFPFDPFGTTWNYFVVHMYQFIGVMYIILQNLVNDTFAASHLALLGGHVHLLSMRVAKIGYNPSKTKKENNQELLDCIRDHKDMLEYRRLLEDVISWYMFFQIMFAGINMCVVLVFVLLFVKDPLTMAYYGAHFLGVFFEVLPSCYYGQLLEDEFQNVAYALFSCNWMEQDIEFRKNLRIFSENAGRRIYVTAWLFRINNNSFIIACKNAYSLFALIMNMR